MANEEGDFIPLDKIKNNLMVRFMDIGHKKQGELAKEEKPFCYPCAKIDFTDEVELKAKDAMRKLGRPLDPDAFKPELLTETELSLDALKTIKNLDNYADPKLFTLETEREIKGEIFDYKTGRTKRQPIAIYKKYRCKRYGHVVGINIPIDKEEEKVQTKKTKAFA